MTPSIGGAAENVSNQATSNLKAGGGGALAMAVGTAVAGDGAGPILGGLAAGSMLEGEEANEVTRVGMMIGGVNIGRALRTNGGGGGNSGGVK